MVDHLEKGRNPKYKEGYIQLQMPDSFTGLQFMGREWADNLKNSAKQCRSTALNSLPYKQ